MHKRCPNRLCPLVVILAFASVCLITCLGNPVNAASQLLELPAPGVEQTVIVDRPLRVENNQTVPPEVTLRIERGGRICIAANVTLTLNGGIEAGPYPIFVGEGDVAGSPKVPAVLPEWLSELHREESQSDPIDWGVAINRAIALAQEGCRRVCLQRCRYRVATPIDLTSRPNRLRADICLEGAVRSTQYQLGTLLVGETGPENCVVDTSDSDGIYTRNIGIVRGATNPSSDATIVLSTPTNGNVEP